MVELGLEYCAPALGEDSRSHLQRLRELGEGGVFWDVSYTQGSADFAMASPLLVWAPPWAI